MVEVEFQPTDVLRQLCDALPALEANSRRDVRVAVELLMDTGRRPDEITELPLDCLQRDSNNKPILIYGNQKSNRLGRRLPIPEPPPP